MITCQGYQSCPVCTHAWSPPLSRGVFADGFRAFLPEHDPGRQNKITYEGEVWSLWIQERLWSPHPEKSWYGIGSVSLRSCHREKADPRSSVTSFLPWYAVGLTLTGDVSLPLQKWCTVREIWTCWLTNTIFFHHWHCVFCMCFRHQELCGQFYKIVGW